jgi:hypothetical protein
MRFFTLLGAVATATLLVVACSSSSDTGGTSTGGSSSGGSGGASSGAQCVGSYADLRQSALSAGVTAAGKCAGPSDVGTICANDVTKAAEGCGSSCYMATPTDKAAQDTCTTACLNTMVTPALGTDCLGCYVADVDCARDHCLIQCGAAPTSQGCATCRATNGCVAAFYTCSGLPMPSTAGGGSGGTGGGSIGAAGAGG